MQRNLLARTLIIARPLAMRSIPVARMPTLQMIRPAPVAFQTRFFAAEKVEQKTAVESTETKAADADVIPVVPPRLQKFTDLVYMFRIPIYSILATYFVVRMPFDAHMLYSFVFVGAVGFLDWLLGPHVKGFLQEEIQGIRKTLYEWRDLNIERFNQMIQALQFRTSATEDIEGLEQYTQEMIVKVREAKKRAVAHAVREEALRQLSLIQKFEVQKLNEIQSRLISNATETVRQSFASGDQKLRSQALDRAIALLNKSEQAVDPVQALFKETLAAERKKAAAAGQALSPEEMEILRSFLEISKRKAAAASH